MDKQEFLELYNKWQSSFMFSAHGSADPAAKESYNKLIEACEINRGDALQYIREILMEEPNDIVNLLDDLFKEEFGFSYEGFCPLDIYCNLWLNVTDAEFDGEHIKDYYKDWREWHEYLKENYISWNPFKEDDPNITLEEYKIGKRNILKERKYHEFTLSILTKEELIRLKKEGHLGEMTKYIKELQPIYKKIDKLLENKETT